MNHNEEFLDLLKNKNEKNAKQKINEKIKRLAKSNLFEAYQVYCILNAEPVQKTKPRK